MGSFVIQTQTNRDTGRISSATIMNQRTFNKYSISISADITDEKLKDLIEATIRTLKSDSLEDFEASFCLMNVIYSLEYAVDHDRHELLSDFLIENEIFNLLKGKMINYKSYIQSDKEIRKNYFKFVLSILVFLSNESVEIAKKIWSDYDLKMSIEDILTDDKSDSDMKNSCLAIVHNCLRRSEVIIKSFASDKVLEYMQNMLKSSSYDNHTKLMITMILSLVVTNEQLHLLDGCGDQVKVMMEFIERQWESNIRTHQGFHIDETLQGLKLVCRSNHMKAVVVSKPESIALLKEVAASNNRSKEVALTLSCFQRLAQLQAAKKKLREYGIIEFFNQLTQTCKFEELHSKIRSAKQDCE